MKLFNFLAAFSLILFIGCGGGGEQQKQKTESADTQETAMASDVRTIDIIGVDQMKFVVEDSAKGITVGKTVGSTDLLLLKGITAKPGEKIRIRLTTKSDLPATAMAHNWILMTMDADVQAFVNAAMKAKNNDYVPSDMTDQVIAQTGLAAGGETMEVTFTAPEKPGEYEFICTFPGHYSAGMKGTFTVKKPGA